MRGLLGRASRLEEAFASEMHAHSRASIAEALQRLSVEELEWLKSASEAHRLGRPFTVEEHAALDAYEAAAAPR
jgi:hypothetical protein